MRSRTARFDRVIGTPYTIASRVDVLFNRQVIISGLPVTAGEVQFDRNAAIMARSTIQVTCSPDDATKPWGRLLPTPTAGGPLSPYGYELQPWVGIAYGDGTEELLSLGIFPTQRLTIDGLTLLATVEGCDRSQQVIDARLEADYPIAAGTNTGTAIQALIEAGVPGLTFAFQSTANTTPAIVLSAEADRWQSAQQMAKDISCELFFDGYGRCVLRSEPGVESSPVVTFTTGALADVVPAGGRNRLTAVQLVLERTASNRVIATGENSANAAVYRGVATDDDPGSQAFYDGAYGHLVRFYASPFISSEEQAASAAASILTSTSGLERGLSFTATPNPAIEPGDIGRVISPAIEVDELDIIDAFTIGLTADALVEFG